MHDGAPPDFAVIVRNFLNETYNNNWIGRGGPVPWPPRSPDFNPLDFCIWGYLKSLMYSRPIKGKLELLVNYFFTIAMVIAVSKILFIACAE
ncbi:hypothetical protein X777_04810 [Ooceraea biroi]|uniref:Uncharacterized protein n=1 Tax=Ooceraea biroi TaxID=2015173 RepID=A0A026WH15_OOCBI|nr:hypothetical protein X777_04810 [Ooceraea biroi]